ncbi:MAG: hypothetical protein UR99_C0064G0007, partial [Candidatus Moranbacteria bacterium GW2011_GWD2_36_12]
LKWRLRKSRSHVTYNKQLSTYNKIHFEYEKAPRSPWGFFCGHLISSTPNAVLMADKSHTAIDLKPLLLAPVSLR